MASIFELSLGPGVDVSSYHVDVVRSPGGDASAAFHLDVEAAMSNRATLQYALLASAVASRRVLLEHEAPVRELGSYLFQCLFEDPAVLTNYRTSHAVAAERGESLTIILRSSVPALAALPWECMYDAEQSEYVCRKGPIVRYVPVPSAPYPLQINPPLRVLGIVSSPRGVPRLDTEREKEYLRSALRASLRDGSLALEWVETATWPELQGKLMSGEWHIVHFIGHGGFDTDRGNGVLYLTRNDGGIDEVESDRFADLLREAQPMPRMVVLNSCSGGESSLSDPHSGTAAALVRGGVAAVVAMQFPITDGAAAAFADGFYRALAHGRPVDLAVLAGRKMILGTGSQTLEWITPMLCVSGENTQLFRLASTPSAASTAGSEGNRQTGAGAAASDARAGEAGSRQQDPRRAPGGYPPGVSSAVTAHLKAAGTIVSVCDFRVPKYDETLTVALTENALHLLQVTRFGPRVDIRTVELIPLSAVRQALVNADKLGLIASSVRIRLQLKWGRTRELSTSDLSGPSFAAALKSAVDRSSSR